jgi:hypothetical protein
MLGSARRNCSMPWEMLHHQLGDDERRSPLPFHLQCRPAFPFPYLHDETQSVARAYGAVCTPDFFGYDRDRKRKYRGRLDGGRTTPPRRMPGETMARRCAHTINSPAREPLMGHDWNPIYIPTRAESGCHRKQCELYCGTVLRQPTALIQAAKDSSPTFALATRS